MTHRFRIALEGGHRVTVRLEGGPEKIVKNWMTGTGLFEVRGEDGHRYWIKRESIAHVAVAGETELFPGEGWPQ